MLARYPMDDKNLLSKVPQLHNDDGGLDLLKVRIRLTWRNCRTLVCLLYSLGVAGISTLRRRDTR